jgi:signal transduction histidine kinase
LGKVERHTTRERRGGDVVSLRLAEPSAVDAHVVQFYESDAFLCARVAVFLGEGLRNGEATLMVATRPHRKAIIERLAAEGHRLDGLVLLDAHETLARIMEGDMPDPTRFQGLLADIFTQLERVGGERPRARGYGEMVNLLWNDGNQRAAIRLEELWNAARQTRPFTLLCAYVMGGMYREDDTEQFLDVCRQHQHVLPTERYALLDESARLRQMTVLERRNGALEHELEHRRQVEKVLREALRERARVEEDLRVAVERERTARAQAEASDAYKEMFLGILGHDLRNPLNTLLTTARLLSMKPDLSSDEAKKLSRMVSSGKRMETMIRQLLDVTRARLADGIPLELGEPHDVAAVVSRIVDELSAASPGRNIVFRREGPCMAVIDTDRMEQAISNLVGNALEHGTPERPITVALRDLGDAVAIDVHNHGDPIEPAAMEVLFDPFVRADTKHARSEGLGLGLYIAERILHAHGGGIAVTSSRADGTRFEARFPKR